MILTLIGIALLMVGIIMLVKSDDGDNFIIFVCGIIGTFLGGIMSLTCICLIIFAHVNVQRTIDTNKIEYDGLCKRLEVIQSEYEDVSKSDVIRDITYWNSRAYDAKYWASNLWTNWMYNKDVADALEYIEY